jgi:hypothetical protein
MSQRVLRLATTVATLALLAFSSVSAQLVTAMTQDKIQEAIALGVSQKESPMYRIHKGGFFGSIYKPVLGFFTTPFARVAEAAYEAKKQYKAFAESDVTQDILAPELRVYGMAQADGARIANFQTIVITPKGGRDAARAIQPSSTTEIPVEFKNAMGMTAQGKSLMAVFPLDVLETNEVDLVYDSGVHNGGEHKYCEDCSVQFKLDKIR